MQPETHLSIESMCRLGQVSRAGFYRRWREHQPGAEETELRSEIQRIAVEHRRNYGYRRVTRELRQQGWAVNHKRVARIMGEDNLLALRRRRFVLTTESRHDLRVYANLAARMELSGIDQLWVADLTYIRLREQFVYLAVILDAFSRRVVGWALDDSLHVELPLAALRKALETRCPASGLVHHSDRGLQYASQQYVALLNQHGIWPSMSAAGNPYDNAKCESFMKTLKQEEIRTRRYCDRLDLEAHLAEFLEQYYNRRRLHSALNYRSPQQFEASLPLQPGRMAVARMSFSRHEEIYRPDVGEQVREEGR
jgi:transposase InsO family protein